MAREEKEPEMSKMAVLLSSLVKSDKDVKNERFDDQILAKVASICSHRNGRNILPILITTEDREKIKRDRQRAVKCEDQIARRRQEKHFDLVDQIKNVLRRIEERKTKKTDESINNSEGTFIRTLDSSDLNNNPSLQTSFEAKHGFDLNSNNQIKDELSGNQGIKQNGQLRQVNSTHNSSPIDFNRNETGFLNQNGYSTPEGMTTYFQQGQTNRFNQSIPLDQLSPYSTSLNKSATLTGLHSNESNRHGFPAGPQTISFRSPSGLSENGPQTWTRSSQSTNAGVKTQEELVAEQKRLKEHFTSLQEQLLAEFQRQQADLIQSYKDSIDLQPLSLQSTLQNVPNTSQNANKTASNISDKENFELRQTDQFPQSPFSLSPKRKNSPTRKGSLPSVTVQSFASELSTGEFYEMPRFQEVQKTNERPSFGDRRTGNKPKSHRKSKTGFEVEVCTPPKLTKLNTFESLHKKKGDNHKFMLVSAYTKGLLARRLFQTEKINSYVTTIKESRLVLNDMNAEGSQSMTDRSFKERVQAQLQCAQDELRKVFVDPSPHLRMHILEQNRNLLREKQARNESKVIATSSHSRPKLSSVTMKKRLSRQERDTKRPSKSNTPSPAVKTTVVSKETPSPKRVEKTTTKPSVVPNRNKTPTTTTAAASKTTLATTNNTTTTVKHVSTFVSGHDMKKVTNTRNSGRVTKPNKIIAAQTKKPRKTWDTAVLKPIQGRISPTIPPKTKSSDGKRQSLSATAKKVDHKSNSGSQQNGPHCNTQGNIKIGSKGYKLNDKPVTRQGAKRSLAANLSMK